jgi:xylulokinase
VFSQVDKVLLPKDYLRLRMTGELASDMSDAAGTMWLDVARRDWSDEMLAACDLSRDAMPALFEGSDVTGQLRPEVAQAWNMPQALVVGGGDNAAGAVGVGMADAGQAMLSLGTSGVYFAVSEGFLSKPESAVHSFCHALPGRWHLMSVMLSAASCLDWAAKLTGLASVPALIAAAQPMKAPVRCGSCPICRANARRTTTRRPRASFWPDASAWAGRAGAGGAGGWAMRWRTVWTWYTPAASSRRASRLSAAGRAALTGGKCWRISAASSSITVPGAMSARRWGRPGWRSWRCTANRPRRAADAAAA